MIYALLQNFMKSLKRGVRVIIEGERLSDKIKIICLGNASLDLKDCSYALCHF